MNIEKVAQPELAKHDASILDLAFVMDCTGSMGSYINSATEVNYFKAFKNWLILYIDFKINKWKEHPKNRRRNCKHGKIGHKTSFSWVQRSSSAGRNIRYKGAWLHWFCQRNENLAWRLQRSRRYLHCSLMTVKQKTTFILVIIYRWWFPWSCRWWSTSCIKTKLERKIDKNMCPNCWWYFNFNY